MNSSFLSPAALLLAASVPLLSCGGLDASLQSERVSRHSEWLRDSCDRCPACCTPLDSNALAYLDDGGVCLEENLDLLSITFSRADLEEYCYTTPPQGDR
jgi:hypothetical protein